MLNPDCGANPPLQLDCAERRSVFFTPSDREEVKSLPAHPVEVGAAVRRAREIYDLGVKREVGLGSGLFSDPAWNMLLDLFISTDSGRRLSVSAVCIGARASAATGLRYLGLLVDADLVRRVADSNDGRRAFVELTEKGWASMMRLLEDRTTV